MAAGPIIPAAPGRLNHAAPLSRSAAMIVYGDPQYEEAISALLARLRLRLAALMASATTTPSLDALRALLIQAGELEQAAHDRLPDHIPAGDTRQLVSQLQQVTDHAAAAFYIRWAASQSAVPVGDGDVPGALARMARALDQIHAPPGVRLTVKVPEGFAFYALYPEQYCAAALRWATDWSSRVPPQAPPLRRGGCSTHAGLPSCRVAVVGIRSIGTTLSAVVSATLAAQGWHPHRLTVRPAGHPYTRHVRIDPQELDRAAWGLVVDEGPGLSGSSMAAAAEALATAGLDRSHISFLPSHDGEPQGATDSVRAWWSTTPRYVVPRSDLRWDHRSLPEALAALTPDLCQSSGPVEQIDDLGGGLWRSFVYPVPDQWPAASVPFEQSKYRCTTGSGCSVLWKFAGQSGAPGGGSAAEAMFTQQAVRAEAGWTAAPLGTAYGFIATRWVEGVPLTRAAAAPAVLAHIGRYLVSFAGPPLSLPEWDASLARLREMLYWNTWEALGETVAARTQRWAEVAAIPGGEAASLTYGDGHLAPHEWLRTPSGQILKTDSTGHVTDHTIIGRQPLAWDVAGALVEWKLDPDAAAPLLASVRASGGPVIPPALLTFYRMAYAAFRLGQCSLCAGMCAHDPDEQARLWRVSTGYREELERLLDSDASDPA
jgi:hypothetical protein